MEKIEYITYHLPIDECYIHLLVLILILQIFRVQDYQVRKIKSNKYLNNKNRMV